MPIDVFFLVPQVVRRCVRCIIQEFLLCRRLCPFMHDKLMLTATARVLFGRLVIWGKRIVTTQYV
jgi:hypothetical protein